jgi:hypothetical protein
MTTIESYAGRKLGITDWPSHPGKVLLDCDDEHQRLYDRRELEAALGVDPDWREKVAQAVQARTTAEARRAIFENRAVNARQERDDWKDRAEKAEAKLARVEEDLIGWQMLRNAWKERAYAAEAKLKLVRDIEQRLAELVKRNEHTPQELDTLIALRAALAETEPPFVLPTTPGAGVIAELGHVVYEFRLFSNGFWIADDGSEYGPQQVLADFTGHRVLDEAAG